MAVYSYQSKAFRLPENGKNEIVSFITQCKNISGSLKLNQKLRVLRVLRERLKPYFLMRQNYLISHGEHEEYGVLNRFQAT